MARALVHRGPGDCGYYIQRDVGLGLPHRRLSIVDLSPAGNQPMTSSGGRYEMVFNAERRPRRRRMQPWQRIIPEASGVGDLCAWMAMARPSDFHSARAVALRVRQPVLLMTAASMDRASSVSIIP